MISRKTEIQMRNIAYEMVRKVLDKFLSEGIFVRTNTEKARDVSFYELASYVLDGKPIVRDRETIVYGGKAEANSED